MGPAAGSEQRWAGWRGGHCKTQRWKDGFVPLKGPREGSSGSRLSLALSLHGPPRALPGEQSHCGMQPHSCGCLRSLCHQDITGTVTSAQNCPLPVLISSTHSKS